jgi:outer membrane biosynthesis protein TonB
MTMHKQGRLLLIGFALSLALHASLTMLIPIVHAKADDPSPDILVMESTPKPLPKQTPPPRATPTPVLRRISPPRIVQKRATAAPHAHPANVAHRVGAPQTVAQAGPIRDGIGTANGVTQGGDDSGTAATSLPAASPAPNPTVTSATCARPDVAAATVTAATPDTPPMAEAQGITGDVEVVVSLDAQSRLIGARVRTSPSLLLNAAALSAARASVFRTAVHDCVPTAADYVFTVAFTAD